MNETAQQSRVATLARTAGIGGPAVTLIGIALVQFGAAPMVGFGLFQFGILLGLAALISGGIGIYTTRNGVGGRSSALTGLGLGVLMIAVVFVSAAPGAGVPPINDITTNLGNPPEFAPAPAGHRNAGRDMSYPPEFIPQVEAAYADLVPIQLDASRDEAYARSVQAAKALGWVVTHEDAANGMFEAEHATAIWHFVDDICVRIASGSAGSATIDVRSKSRDGRGDLGANAKRIRAFTAKVKAS